MAKHARHEKMTSHNQPSTGNAFDLSMKGTVAGEASTVRIAKPPRHEKRGSDRPDLNDELYPDEGGIDSAPQPGVQSGFSVFNPAAVAASTSKESIMAKAPKTPVANTTANEMTPEAKAAAEAAAAEKKQAAEKAAAEKAEAKAKREAAAAEKKEAVAKAKAEREARAAENKAKREAKIAELQASGKKYTGTMLALSEAIKSGAYVKSITGQLRSTDELATALDGVTPNGTIQLGMALLQLEANPYAQLNVGQQSMNLRNRLRGALKKGTVTIAAIKEYVEANGLDVSGELKAKKEAAAAAKAKREEEAKAKKEAAEKAAAEKKAKTAEPAGEAATA